ncbi:MAG: OmpA family protein [Bacteroidetes bacterium]|nr:OmpA family protein [Bacteroidota bacterium]
MRADRDFKRNNSEDISSFQKEKSDSFFFTKNSDQQETQTAKGADPVAQKKTAPPPTPVTDTCKNTDTPEAQFGAQNPGQIFEIGESGGSRNEEISLWNFCAGEITLRQKHKEKLKELAPKWKKTLLTDSEIQIRVSGAASLSGSQDANHALAIARANSTKSALISEGISSDRIIVDSNVNERRLSPEKTPEGAARDRRVDVSLFKKTLIANKLLPFSDAIISNLKIGAHATPTPRQLAFRKLLDFRGNNFIRTHPAMSASADVMLTSLLGGSSAGMLQVLNGDIRQAKYVDNRNKSLMLDYSNCFKLPCKDTNSGTETFSNDSASLFINKPDTQSKNVFISDWPGAVFPLRYPDPKSGPFVLQSYKWQMNFTIVLGVRDSGFFTPLKSVIWGVAANEDVDVAAKQVKGNAPVSTFGKWTDGMVTPMNLEQVMSGASCRFFARGTDTVCQPLEK